MRKQRDSRHAASPLESLLFPKEILSVRFLALRSIKSMLSMQTQMGKGKMCGGEDLLEQIRHVNEQKEIVN